MIMIVLILLHPEAIFMLRASEFSYLAKGSNVLFKLEWDFKTDIYLSLSALIISIVFLDFPFIFSNI